MEKVKNKSKETRSVLAPLEGQMVNCTGRFVMARVINEQFINILFRDVFVENSYFSHLWIIHNDEFEGKDLRHNCIVKFRGVVKKYSDTDERYGVAYCRSVEVMSYDHETENEELEDIFIKLKKIDYNTNKYKVPENAEKAYIKFAEDYELPVRKRLKLVYSPLLTLKNKNRELEFEAYDEDGKIAEFSRVTFNPVTDDYRVSVDDRYYVKINATAYRKLCLLYYLVTRTQNGFMAFVPEEVQGEYFALIDSEKSVYYHNTEEMFTVRHGETACIGRPDRKKEKIAN